MVYEQHSHDYLLNDLRIAQNEKKTTVVVILTAIMMIIEITFGYITGSMALLADGWHMASHTAALSIALIAYRLAKSPQLTKHFSFGTGKIIPLGGYTSAIVLAMVALFMAVESFSRLLNPVAIHFQEAIGVAVLGLIVNIVSAVILSHDHDHKIHHNKAAETHHHDNHHHDHNLRSAYIHVIADALTSVLAIAALVIGLFYGANWLDPLMGVVGSVVILKWAYNLCRDVSWELLDGHSKNVDTPELIRAVEKTDAKILDLHVWKIAPNANSCSLVVQSPHLRGSEFYRAILEQDFNISHSTIEELIRN